jgi:proteic killer suppression protein
MYSLIFPDKYKKLEKKFIKKHPDLIDKYIKTIEILKLNPYHPSLRLYRLKGELNKFFSVSINISKPSSNPANLFSVILSLFII